MVIARICQDPETATVVALARRFAGIVHRGRVGEAGDRNAVVADLTAWLVGHHQPADPLAGSLGALPPAAQLLEQRLCGRDQLLPTLP